MLLCLGVGGGSGGSGGNSGNAVPRSGLPGAPVGGTPGGGVYAGICLGGGCAGHFYVGGSGDLGEWWSGIRDFFGGIFGGHSQRPHAIPQWRTRPGRDTTTPAGPGPDAVVVGVPQIITPPGGGDGGAGGGGGGGRGPTSPYTQQPIFDWIGGATSSFGDSIRSIGLGVVGSVDCYLTDNCHLADMAYDVGPLGQTDGAGWYGTWTRRSLSVSETAIEGAVGGYGFRGLSALSRFRTFGWLNHNRYLRIGPSHFPGRGAAGASRHVPQVRIGAGNRWWSHWRLP
jgi:hypothetical protein